MISCENKNIKLLIFFKKKNIDRAQIRKKIKIKMKKDKLSPT